MSKLELQALNLYEEWWKYDVDIKGFQAALAKFFETVEKRYPNQTKKIRDANTSRVVKNWREDAHR